MGKMNRAFLSLVLILILLVNGCSNNEISKQEEYEKCTSVCASVLSDDFVTMELCRQECKREFLEGK